MKLLKALTISSIFLITNVFAATISGYTYCDINPEDGVRDPINESCTNEGVWVKLSKVADNGGIKVVSVEPDRPSGYFEFNINDTGSFTLFIDSNGDGKD